MSQFPGLWNQGPLTLACKTLRPAHNISVYKQWIVCEGNQENTTIHNSMKIKVHRTEFNEECAMLATKITSQ
jgi:hypothetical protein